MNPSPYIFFLPKKPPAPKDALLRSVFANVKKRTSFVKIDSSFDYNKYIIPPPRVNCKNYLNILRLLSKFTSYAKLCAFYAVFLSCTHRLFALCAPLFYPSRRTETGRRAVLYCISSTRLSAGQKISPCKEVARGKTGQKNIPRGEVPAGVSDRLFYGLLPDGDVGIPGNRVGDVAVVLVGSDAGGVVCIGAVTA